MHSFKTYISESLNTILPFVGKTKRDGLTFYEYRTNSGKQLLIGYMIYPDGGASVEFKVDGTIQITNDRESLSILATVVHNIGDVFRKESIQYLIFAYDNKRDTIYSKLFKRFGKNKDMSVLKGLHQGMGVMVVADQRVLSDSDIFDFARGQGVRNITKVI